MVFSSDLFIFFFLPAVLLAYYLSPRRTRNLCLLAFSLIFYSWGEPVYILIMLFSTAFDYINGRLIERFRARQKPRAARAVMINSIIVNLGILGFFKYGSFITGSLNTLLHVGIKAPEPALPIGISFYTFQTLSYTIDVFRGQVGAQRSLIDFGAYVTMFPQLIAGPIVQYKDIEGQLSSRRETLENFTYGIRRFIVGLSKKVLLANNVGLLWKEISGGGLESLSSGLAWLGALAFSLQIYFDFSGYSDMAIGLGAMFGFRFRENFQQPYRSKSITEFWRRWHISLGAWFREYVYIPLGGSRKGRGRQALNLLIVWGLTGLWHGASWNFVLWGLYFGLLLVAEKLLLPKVLDKIPAFVRHIATLILVVFSWMIFAFEDFGEMRLYLRAMLGLNHAGFLSGELLYYLGTGGLLLIACGLCSLCSVKGAAEKLERHPALAFGTETLGLSALFFACVCFLVGDSYNPFLYFRF